MKKSTIILILIAALIFSFAHFFQSTNQVNGLNDNWKASEKWIESAECARTTGVLLAGCVNEKIIPYSQLSLADDVGHALFLGLYSVATGKSLVLEHAGLLNVLINFTGLWLLTAIVLGARQFMAAAAILVGGSISAGGFIGVAPHNALQGVTCYAMALPLVILLYRNHRWMVLVPTLIVCGSGLAIATLIRQSIGMMGSVASFIALLVAVSFVAKTSRRVALSLIVLPIILAASMSTTAVLAMRDAVWNVSAGNLIDRHGVQHNLFIGLGVIENSFGVQWDDMYGLEAAQKVDPDVEYVSEDYYRILGQEYTKLLLSDPMEVARIYALKAYTFLKNPIRGNLWAEMPLYLALILVTVFAYQSRRSNADESADCTTFIAYLFAAMHFGQAVLINPDMQYGSPAALLFLIVLASAIRPQFYEAMLAGRVPAGSY